MKTRAVICAIALLSIFYSQFTFGQCYHSSSTLCNSVSSSHNTSKEKVLYVDKFLQFNGGTATNPIVDQNNSLLGVDPGNDLTYEKEDDLLNYALNNDFTTLILYDVHNVFNFANVLYRDNINTRTDTYAQNLRRFIIKAKTLYGIHEIEVAIGGFSTYQSTKYWNGIHETWPCALINDPGQERNIDTTSDPTPLPAPDEEIDYLQECKKVVDGVFNFNKVSNYYAIGEEYSEEVNGGHLPRHTVRPISGTCYLSAIIDRMVTEYEYWNFPFHGKHWPFMITEVTVNKTGTGATSTYPSWLNNGEDYIEIANLAANNIKISGMTVSDYASGSSTPVHTLTFPSGTEINANSVMVIHLGSGTDDPTHQYYNTGGTTNNWSSSSQLGVVFQKGSYIIDAVGINSSYQFHSSTGVTSNDFSNNVSIGTSAAGIIRQGMYDNNDGSDWITASSTNIQTLGSNNSTSYWTGAADDDYADFQVLVRYMQCAQLNSQCPLGVDIYIGWPGVNGSNSSTYGVSAQDQLFWIDANADRIYLHKYKCNPTDLFDINELRLKILGDVNSTPNSEIDPIFSAESHSVFGSDNDFLGDFLTDQSVHLYPNGGYTLACAENIFQDGYDQANLLNGYGGDNIIDGYAWFTYTILNNPLHYPLLRKSQINDNIYSDVPSGITIEENLNTFVISADSKISVEVINLVGQRVYLSSNNAGKITLEKNKFKNGAYILNAISQSGTERKKVVLGP